MCSEVRTSNVYRLLEPDHFRLLILDPAPPDDPDIRCSLQHVPYSNPPSYEALSYTWGDESNNQQIWIDGHPVEVRWSLFTALRKFRFPEKPRRLWADAICINQADLDEKSVQIGQMRDIYRRAEEVAIWLGEEQILEPLVTENGPFDFSGYALECIPVLARKAKSEGWVSDPNGMRADLFKPIY